MPCSRNSADAAATILFRVFAVSFLDFLTANSSQVTAAAVQALAVSVWHLNHITLIIKMSNDI